MPASARALAVLWPSKVGAPSSTITSKLSVLCASIRNWIRVSLMWYVRIRSFSLMCSFAYSVTFLRLMSISSRVSRIRVSSFSCNSSSTPSLWGFNWVASVLRRLDKDLANMGDAPKSFKWSKLASRSKSSRHAVPFLLNYLSKLVLLNAFSLIVREIPRVWHSDLSILRTRSEQLRTTKFILSLLTSSLASLFKISIKASAVRQSLSTITFSISSRHCFAI